MMVQSEGLDDDLSSLVKFPMAGENTGRVTIFESDFQAGSDRPNLNKVSIPSM